MMDKDNILKNLFEIIQECERFSFLIRDEEFQIQSITKLEQIKKEVSKEKNIAITNQGERTANIMLSAENVIEALVSELKMWIALKKREYDKAWDLLIEAQSYLRNSYQASTESGFNFDGYSNKLLFIEMTIFPKPMFMSPAMIIESTLCSICNKNYDECDHIVGKAYMGRLCYQIVNKIKEMKGLAIVEQPANKHARITNFTENGITRDIFTWKEIKEKDSN